jgi:predicted FMN-binding regulatory protein PaiB
VHVQGPISIRDDAQLARAVVARLRRKHESIANEATAWKMADALRDQDQEAICGAMLDAGTKTV